MTSAQPVRVALAGNPNSGKTSIFNALTGARQHVGNYAGVTVEKREGQYRFNGLRHHVVDLPGTYSLSAHSPEERIAQDELLAGEFDVVVAVIDSTNLRRSLVLVAQLMQLGANPVLCLNMSDEAKAAGQDLNLVKLQQLLGFPVIETIGHRGVGIDRLQTAVLDAAHRPVKTSSLVLGTSFDRAVAAVAATLKTDRLPPARRNWAATRLLVDDQGFRQSLREAGISVAAADDAAALQRERIRAETSLDMSLFVMERYYRFIDALLEQVIARRPRADARAASDRVDALLVNRLIGLPVFFAVLYGIFWMTFTLGEIPMAWIETGFGALGNWVSSRWPAGSDSLLRSLLVDGVINGVGGVVIFLPNIVLLFLGLAFLEDTGYMSRAAFVMDRLMHRFGLHGRSFIPMMTGFGCSIPGIMATRTLENERDRLATMLVLPLMSCGARLPIWMLLIPAFFPPGWRAPMLWLIYAIGVGLALLLALLLRKSLLRGEAAPFVMELAPYRIPTGRALARKMIERSWIYLRKAGTVILAISILMWFITAYPKKSSYEVDAAIAAGEQISGDEADNRRASEDLRYSLAGRIGATMEPLIKPLGFDWRIGTGLIGAFAAKEVFVAQMGIVYSMGDADEGAAGLQTKLRQDYPPLVGFVLMLFLLIATPCMATIAVTRRESGSWRWALLQLGGLTAIAYLLSALVYQIGRLVL